jgi:GMP synthase-like glutamine amidotransferase
MRVLVIRHHDVDTAGFIADAFEASGAEITMHLFPDEGPLPSFDGVDHIVVMGAVSSVNDPDPWIAAELDWLRAADQAGLPVFGICFGAQALCAALGGRVEAMGTKEIGWYTVDPVGPDPAGSDSAGSDPAGSDPASLGAVPAGLGAVPAGPWLEFHGDRCLLPAGAIVLARNDLAVQAFRLGRHFAVQFHPEVDGPQLKRWLDSMGTAEVESIGLDPDQFLADTIREEPAAKARAARLVAAALGSR